MAKNNESVLDFLEAVELLRVGAHGFKFSTGRGGIFAVELDHNEPPRPKITHILEDAPEEKPE